MTPTFKSILMAVLFVLSGFIIGIVLSYCTNQTTPQIETITVRDTCYIRDTITTTKVVNQTKYCYDTIVVNDTVYIQDKPITYTDSTKDYRLEIDAVKLYDYSLSIYRVDTIYRQRDYIVPNQTKRGKFGQSIHLGVYVGYGLDIQTQPKFSPSVGVCVSYGFGYNW